MKIGDIRKIRDVSRTFQLGETARISSELARVSGEFRSEQGLTSGLDWIAF